MYLRVAVVAALCALSANAVTPSKVEAVPHTFMSSKASSATVPALQPHDTYDEDFPITNRGLTPSQLRYKAQADYAKAVAEMKEEEAEAMAAKRLAESELAKHKAALD